MSEPATVFVVDDDAAVRDSLAVLFRAAGLPVQVFADGNAFLHAYAGGIGCLIVDQKMPGMSGTELQARLSQRGAQLPTVFLTGHGDVTVSVRAVKGGAVDFLLKPVSGEVLLQRVREVLADTVPHQELWSRLTDRERAILAGLVGGRSSKLIAADLGISRRTVEGHRANLMRKLGARNALELLNLARGFNLSAFAAAAPP